MTLKFSLKIVMLSQKMKGENDFKSSKVKMQSVELSSENRTWYRLYYVKKMEMGIKNETSFLSEKNQKT